MALASTTSLTDPQGSTTTNGETTTRQSVGLLRSETSPYLTVPFLAFGRGKKQADYHFTCSPWFSSFPGSGREEWQAGSIRDVCGLNPMSFLWAVQALTEVTHVLHGSRDADIPAR
ncbi:hypothetical protein E2C01_016937 [Portunus trituberculatus]|uniref:Uncharacterized protein n=1 Tax=Portunus trituberculatus TaxID=210409 RepID=A0A5B7DRZ7_PORTR|nr:hypothetical protein [Portunus trituberculatus]